MIAILEKLLESLFAALAYAMTVGRTDDVKEILAKLDKRSSAFGKKVDDWIAKAERAEDLLFEEAFDDDTQPG